MKLLKTGVHFIIWIVWVFCTPVFAENISASLCAQIIHINKLSTESTAFSDCFYVSKSSSMHLSILLPVGSFNISLTSPSNQVIPWNPASTAISCDQVTVQPDPQGPIIANTYHFTIGAPADGVWTLSVQAAVPLTMDWECGIVNIDFDSEINAGVCLLTHETTIGNALSASLIVLDGMTQLYNCKYDVRLFCDGSPVILAQPIIFTSNQSLSGGDPTLIATFKPPRPGTYNLIVNIKGMTTVGGFERTVATGFIVYPQNAKLTGSFTQREELCFPDSLP
jgi:hypothetical protein